MRNMSFSHTKEQFKNGTKDVTRRLGWKNLKPGEHFIGVEKAQGLKKGERVVRLGECVCIRNETEPLFMIISYPKRNGRKETEREGFPQLTAGQFVEFFCKNFSALPDTEIQRIEFERVKPDVSLQE